jgi:HAD superfamily hydrolase (TIGR01509 family)
LPTAIFDIGSTLIEGPSSGPAARIAAALSLSREARQSVQDVLVTSPAGNAEELADAIAARLEVPAAAIGTAVRDVWTAQLQEAYMLPGAKDAIDRLRVEGIRRAYLSNIWPPFYAAFERAFPEEAAGETFLSFREGRMKPDREFFLMALRKLAIPPESAVLIGDTYGNDIAPALALGCHAIWILHRPSKEISDILAVLNGNCPAPDFTLGMIGELRPEHVRRAVAKRRVAR